MKSKKYILITVLFTALTLVSGFVFAGEYDVSDADGLSAAMASAESTVGIGDTINIAAGAYSITSTLLLLDSTESSLALIGEGPDQTFLDGNGNTQILRIDTSGGAGPTSSILIKDLTFRNGSSTAEGGAVWVRTNAAELVVDNVWFEKNVSVNDGGGLYFSSTGGNMEVKNSFFFSNHNTGATQADGGGLSGQTGGSGDIKLQESSFEKNHANGYSGGGAIVIVTDGILNVERNSFKNNDATSVGGGLYVQTLGTLGTAAVKNCLFTNNEANLGGGLNTSAASGPLSVINNTAVSNSAASGAGGMYASLNSASASLEIYNNIFYGNIKGSGGGQDIYVASNSNGPVTVKYNNIEDLFVTDPGVLTEEFNIDVDPLLDAQYMLSAGSSCIDAGDSDAMDETVDLSGNPRFRDDPQTADTGNSTGDTAVIDMGAYEFQPPGGGGGGGGGGGCSTTGERPAGPVWPGLLGIVLVVMVLVGMRRGIKQD